MHMNSFEIMQIHFRAKNEIDPYILRTGCIHLTPPSLFYDQLTVARHTIIKLPMVILLSE